MVIDPHGLDSGIEGPSYEDALAQFERDIFLSVDHELRGHAAGAVHAALLTRLSGRLPGIAVDDEVLLLVADKISSGTLRSE